MDSKDRGVWIDTPVHRMVRHHGIAVHETTIGQAGPRLLAVSAAAGEAEIEAATGSMAADGAGPGRPTAVVVDTGVRAPGGTWTMISRCHVELRETCPMFRSSYWTILTGASYPPFTSADEVLTFALSGTSLLTWRRVSRSVACDAMSCC